MTTNRLGKRPHSPFTRGLSRLSCLGLCLIGLNTSTAQAAERIFVAYSLLERSISVSALETYAREGRITSDLVPYARYLNEDQLQQLRTGLQTKVELSPVILSQSFYTPIGEELLKRVGQVIYPKSGQGELYALRSALILAAADPQGLTFLNVLKYFPNSGIKVDLQRGLDLFKDGQALVKDTNLAVANIQAQATANGTAAPILEAPPLATPGPYQWDKSSLELNDQTPERLAATGKARSFPVDIYLPQTTAPQPLPVVVISHGLNSDRNSYDYLAEHLASHGFAVAAPAHPGSDAQLLQALLQGTASDVAKPVEFIDRPLDVKFLLNELEARNQTDPVFQGRLNLTEVGVIGQSYGGYTALALAGAPLNFEQLQQDCSPQSIQDTLNLSLLLQCKAMRLPRRTYNLSDPRVKAILVINPINSAVFGQTSLSKIQIPVMMISGSADTVAPALYEQVQPFRWLTAPQKYFVLMDRGTHFSTISPTKAPNPETEFIPDVPAIIGPSPNLARSYTEALSLAMMGTHIGRKPNYAAYLTSGYAATLSQPSLPLSLVTNLSQQAIAPPSQP